MNANINYTHRLEVRFTTAPPAAVRECLKDRGFWWDSKAKCWWLARPVTLRFVRNEPVTQDGFKWALDFCRTHLGLTNERAEELTRLRDGEAVRQGDAAMEEACGIA